MEKKIQKKLKKGIDMVGASAGLLILIPLFAVVAVLIKFDSRGPVLFKYERIGKDGKPFFPYKFRTMKVGAIKEGLGFNVSKDDYRITKVGNFLRNWGIDELPQLFNVLRGEMSLVGPRPTLRYQVDHYNEFQKQRLSVKPGLTGWALIHGRNSLSWEERIKYDVWYAQNWSILLDLKILIKTVEIVLSKKGLYGKEGKNDPFI